MLPGGAEPRRPLRRVVLHRGHDDRHLLPPELSGDHAHAARTCASTRPPRPPSRTGSGRASAAVRMPHPARPSGTSAPTSSPGRCASSPMASSTGRASPGWRRRLNYSERHLNRLLTAELGAGPLALARAQRAHTARLLIETTDLPFTQVAFASGFASVRQFNDTVREVFCELADRAADEVRRPAARRAARHDRAAPPATGSVRARCAVRLPRLARGPRRRGVGRRHVPPRARPSARHRHGRA